MPRRRGLSERVETRVDRETKRRLEQRAAHEERKEAAIVRRAIRFYLDLEDGEEPRR